MDLDPTRLILDHGGRYVQGPKFGKGGLIESLEGEPIPMPLDWPDPDGDGIVCVVTNPAFEAALLITDVVDYSRCRISTENGRRPCAWYRIPARVVRDAQIASIFAELPDGW